MVQLHQILVNSGKNKTSNSKSIDMIFFRSPYPETTYITTTPGGTIGPITVRERDNELFDRFLMNVH